ncbi:polysaccharide pyruvyl transferase family protein, partial [bacterium]|nr:polysaccharide pyruvyl transferase family protein [bacterium]
ASTLEIVKELYPDSTLTVFANNPDLITRRYCVKTLPKGESPASFFGAFFRSFIAIKKCDLFIWGGGQLVQDISSQFYIPNHIWRFFLALLFKKRVLVFAVGVSSLQTRFSRFLIKWHFQRTYHISVRDLESSKVLQTLGLNPDKIKVLFDPALAMKDHDEKRGKEILKDLGLDMTRPIIGFAPRRLFHRKHGLIPMKYKIKWDLIPSKALVEFEYFSLKMAESLSNAISCFDAQILFIPMYKGPGQEDDRICRDIANRMTKNGEIFHLPKDLTAKDVHSVISQLSLVIGVRMHALILASSCGIPFIGINYASKGESFCRMMGMEDFGVNAEDFNPLWLNSKIKECLENKIILKNTILKSRDKLLNSVSLTNFLGIHPEENTTKDPLPR